MITVSDGMFLEEGRPYFLYGAELHYFRVDPGEWPNRLDRIREAGFNTIGTYIPWLWHEPEEGVFDFSGNTHPRRDLEGFLRACRDAGLRCIVRPGPYVMSELRREGIPEWVLSRHPEVIAQTADGNPHPASVLTYLHPQFVSLARRWYQRVAEVIRPHLATAGGPVILFQLDNEVGMLHWVTGQSDYSPTVMEAFWEYWEDEGRARWGDSIPHRMRFLLDAGGGPKAGAQAGDKTGAKAGLKAAAAQEIRQEFGRHWHWIWHAFWRRYLARYIETLRDVASESGVNVPFVVNVHGFKDYSVYSRGVDYPVGLSQLLLAARVPGVLVAGDFYPGRIGYDNVHDIILASVLTKAVGRPEQPLFSVEFQSGRLADRPRVYPQDLDLLTRVSVAHGMNALNYYMFCGGDNPPGIGLFGSRHDWQAPIGPDGRLRPAYGAARHLGRMLQSFGGRLCGYAKAVDTWIGFYPDYYMTEAPNDAGEEARKAVSELQFQREHHHFDGLWRLMAAANLSFEAVTLERGADLDPGRIPSLFVAATDRMDRETQDALARYVQDGGRLAVGPRLPDKDLAGEPCRVLADALGIGEWAEERGYGILRVLDDDSVFCRQHLLFTDVPIGERVAWREEDGLTAAFLRRVGRGEALVLGVALTSEFRYAVDVVRSAARKLGVVPSLSLSDSDVLASERRGADGAFLFLHNVDDTARKTTVTRGGRELFDGAAVEIPPRAGLMLPLDLELPQGARVHYSSLEIVSIEQGEGMDRLQFAAGGDGGGRLCLGGDLAQVSIRSGSAKVLRKANGDWKIEASERTDGDPLVVEVRYGKNRIVLH